jgi:hypothetical protein
VAKLIYSMERVERYGHLLQLAREYRQKRVKVTYNLFRGPDGAQVMHGYLIAVAYPLTGAQSESLIVTRSSDLAVVSLSAATIRTIEPVE